MGTVLLAAAARGTVLLAAVARGTVLLAAVARGTVLLAAMDKRARSRKFKNLLQYMESRYDLQKEKRL